MRAQHPPGARRRAPEGLASRARPALCQGVRVALWSQSEAGKVESRGFLCFP